MSNPLQDLIDKHPRLFRGTPPQTLSHLPAGWYGIMDQLCVDLAQMLGPSAAEFEWIQIQEKFGSLRPYWRLDGRKPTEIVMFVRGPKPGPVPTRLVRVAWKWPPRPVDGA